jgi:beta-lactamase superfamily II metal-dependent hydrolase
VGIELKQLAAWVVCVCLAMLQPVAVVASPGLWDQHRLPHNAALATKQQNTTTSLDTATV